MDSKRASNPKPGEILIWAQSRAHERPVRSALRKDPHVVIGADGVPQAAKRLSLVRRNSKGRMLVALDQLETQHVKWNKDVAKVVGETYAHNEYDRSCLEVSPMTRHEEYVDYLERETAARAEAYRKKKADDDLLALHNEAAAVITRFIRFVASVKCSKIGNSSAAFAINRAFITSSNQKSKQLIRKKLKKRRSFSKQRDGVFRRSVHEGDLILEGYLQKMSSGLRKQWQTRFFIVTGHYLKYYESHQKETLKAATDLHSMLACATVLDQHTQEPIVLQLKLRSEVGEEEVYLRAADETETKKWSCCFSAFLDAADDTTLSSSDSPPSAKGVAKPKKKETKKRRSSFNKKKNAFRASINDGDLLMQGWMKKKSTGKFSSWQNRFFEVTGHYLKYYSDEKKEKCKAVVDLNHLIASRREDDGTMFLSLTAAGDKSTTEAGGGVSIMEEEIRLKVPEDQEMAAQRWMEVFAYFAQEDESALVAVSAVRKEEHLHV